MRGRNSLLRGVARGCAAAAVLLTVACGDGTTDSVPGTSEGPNGSYLGLVENFTTGEVSAEFYTFLADGRVFNGLPAEGFARPLDWETECFYAGCGAFRQSGSEVRLQLSSGDKVMTLDAQGVLHEGGKGSGYRRVHPLDGVTLDATYGYLNEQGDTIVSVAFTAAGRFREYRLLQHTFWTEWGPDREIRRQAPTRGSGTYTLRQGTLELKYDDGRTAYMMAMVPPGVQPTPVPQTIYFGVSDIARLP